jgi:ring-1,2-phenylacetyl-CoA epoxidase subunit PaaE
MHDYQPLRIVEVAPETADAVVVTLEVPPALADAFRFMPGQHLPVRTSIDGAEQRRTYSICRAPGGSCVRVAIKRVPGGAFSNWANYTLSAGTMLDVMPPAGRFVLPESDGRTRHIVAFAAGAGITPLLAMIEHGLTTEPETGFTLVYGNRGPDSIMFRRELEDLKDRYLGRFTLLYVLSRNEEPSAPLLEGRITGDKVKALAASLFKPEEVAHFFLCGPGSMIKETRNALLALGVPRERVHHEFFAPGGGGYRAKGATAAPRSRHAEGVLPARREGRGEGQPQPPARASQGAEVIAILDGLRHRFMVPPGGQVVDAALAAGIRVPYSCKGGMCCTCRAKVVEGKADMVVNYSLEPWEIERGFILTCQAVPKSERLVLDYDAM